MRTCRILGLCVFLSFHLFAFFADGQPTNFYWDVDGVTEGAGGPSPSGNWDFTANWNTIADGTGDPTTWVDGNIAIFSAGTNATDPYTVTVVNKVTVDSVNVEEGAITLSGAGIDLMGSGAVDISAGSSATVDSAFGGAVGLTKNGVGALSLTGANIYSGPTAITAGTLTLGASERIPNGSALSIASGAVFNLNNFSETVGSIAGSGDIALGSGTLTAGGDNISSSFSGALSGSGRVIKSGTGTLTITGANTHSGGITVNGGGLSFPGESSGAIGAANPLGATPASTIVNYLTLNNGATLTSTHSGAGGSFAFASRGITVGTGGGVLEVTSTALGDYLIYGGIIAGSGTVTKSGAGTLALNGANTYSGNTTNGAGTLRVSTSTVLGSATTSTLVLAGGNLSAPVDGNVYIQNKLLMLANTTVSGTPTSSARAVVFGNSSIVSSNGTLTIRNIGGGAVAFQGRFTNGGFNFSRPIIIGQAGDQPAQLDCYTDNLGASPIAEQTFSGNISGPGSVRRTCGGDGTGGKTIFSGTNTYTGGTILNGGYIGFGNDSTGTPITSGPVGTGTITIGQDASDGFYASGGAHKVGNTISFGTGVNITILGTNALTLSGSVVLPAASTSLSITNTALTLFSGVISGGVSGATLTKIGPGTLAFSNANTYIENTLVAGGTLLVNNAAGSGTGTGTVTVNSGCTLGGKGIVSGAVTVGSGGKISPGNNVGTLTLKGGANLSTGGSYLWDLSANSTLSPGVNFDQLAVTAGNLVLGGTSKLTLNFTNSATVPNLTNSFWRSAHSWTLVALSGTAANPALTRFASVSSTQYPSLKYFTNTTDSSGNVILTYDPTSPFYATYDAGPGFFGGENLILTNTSGLTLSIWSSTTGGQSITNWALAGAMSEQPLNDGTGNSRYSINLTPTTSPTYYIAGKITSGPYAPTVAVQWMTTDAFGNYSLFATNVAINAAGVLDLPVPPDISQQPLGKTVLAGKTVTLSVTASSFTSMGYQWFFDGSTAGTNGTNSSLTVPAITTFGAGTYDVVITNAHGSTISSNALLNVIPPPQLTAQAVSNGFQFSGTAVAGDTYWLQAATNLNPPVAWITMATNVAGEDGSFQFTDTSLTAQSNRFYRLEAP